MDNFARQPSDERRLYFEQAAARQNISAQILEKDFWVCWALRKLFSLSEFRDHLTFKGGTSLSKIYNVIERFSEDVDVAIERKFLGFGYEKEPEAGNSGKEQQRRIEQLKKACQQAIVERLQPQLREAMADTIGDSVEWKVSLDPSDPDQQSILFQYPAAITDGLSPYFARSVKIEMGARSDHFPVERAEITPYLADVFPPDSTFRLCNGDPCLVRSSDVLGKDNDSPSAVSSARGQAHSGAYVATLLRRLSAFSLVGVG